MKNSGKLIRQRAKGGSGYWAFGSRYDKSLELVDFLRLVFRQWILFSWVQRTIYLPLPCTNLVCVCFGFYKISHWTALFVRNAKISALRYFAMLFIAALICLFYSVWGMLIGYPRPGEDLLETQSIANALGLNTSAERIYYAWSTVPNFHFALYKNITNYLTNKFKFWNKFFRIRMILSLKCLQSDWQFFTSFRSLSSSSWVWKCIVMWTRIWWKRQKGFRNYNDNSPEIWWSRFATRIFG